MLSWDMLYQLCNIAVNANPLIDSNSTLLYQHSKNKVLKVTVDGTTELKK